MNVLVAADISSENIIDYAKTGVTAVITQNAIFTNPPQTMADIITRARILQSAWQAASP